MMKMVNFVICGGGLVAKSCLIFATPWILTHQAPLCLGFSGQEHWSGLPFPSAGDLPHPGVKFQSHVLQVDFFLPTELQGKPVTCILCVLCVLFTILK